MCLIKTSFHMPHIQWLRSHEKTADRSHSRCRDYRGDVLPIAGLGNIRPAMGAEHLALEVTLTIRKGKSSGWADIYLGYPACFVMITSKEPCPCGFYNHPEKECVCGPGVIKRYMNKISGPLLDRIDLHVEVTPVSYDELSSNGVRKGETSDPIRDRVKQAREIQTERFKDNNEISSNARMPSRVVRDVCEIDQVDTTLLKTVRSV